MEQKNESPAEQGKGNLMSLMQDKGKQTLGQYQTTYLAFHGIPKTMLQVSLETGILRANICRYIAEMLDKEQIKVVRKGLCPYTKTRAGFYSTDPALFPKPDPTLFDYGV